MRKWISGCQAEHGGHKFEEYADRWESAGLKICLPTQFKYLIEMLCLKCG